MGYIFSSHGVRHAQKQEAQKQERQKQEGQQE
jgi:hypothetical protein